MTAFIEQASGSLVRLGFGIVADLWRADFSFMRVVLMRDLKTGEEASVVALRGDDGRDQTLIELTTQFADGRELNVNNFGLGVFAPAPGKITERFPGVTDPASLCRISRQLIRRHYGGTDVTPPDDGGDPAAYLTAAMRRELTNQVATGYYRWDEAGEAFRPTWKGALLMTWKLLPPFRQKSASHVCVGEPTLLMKEVASA
jgi:hypothetical protein